MKMKPADFKLRTLPRLRMFSALILAFTISGCSSSMDEAAETGTTEASAEAAGNGETSTPPVQMIQVPAGTSLIFALEETLNTGTTASGELFQATLAEPVVVNGATVIPQGASAKGRVTSAEQSGRVQGRASIRLQMTEISTGTETAPLSTHPFEARAEGSTGEDAVTIGAGAGIGAAIGAALGGGQGAAIGAAIGGGSGTAVVMATRGDEIELGAGTPINFQLSDALVLNR